MEELTLRGLLSKIDTLQSTILSYQTTIQELKNDIASLKGIDKQLSTLCSNYIEECKSLCESIKSENVDEIQKLVSNATYNISSLTSKLERLQKQLSTVNGYVASNNFKSNKPEQDKLTQFVIECMSTASDKITRDQLPSGTKIKNTFDNHLWVLNKVSIDGLVTYRWEDFGSDEICIANNDGVHGLVTGSNEKYQGHIDLQGVISINGLVDDIDNILQSLQSVGKIVKEYDERLLKIESMLGLSNKE